jgi:hypothetical protein
LVLLKKNLGGPTRQYCCKYLIKTVKSQGLKKITGLKKPALKKPDIRFILYLIPYNSILYTGHLEPGVLNLNF